MSLTVAIRTVPKTSLRLNKCASKNNKEKKLAVELSTVSVAACGLEEGEDNG